MQEKMKPMTGKQLTKEERPPRLDVHNALLYAQDILERSQVSFILLGEIAKNLHRGHEAVGDANSVELAVMKKDCTVSGKSTLESIAKQKFENDELNIKYKNVDIKIKIYDPESFFLNPDTKFYTLTEFKIPNPFKAYAEANGL